MEKPESSRQQFRLNEPKPQKVDPDAWVEIGILKHAIIYPIDGGAGCTQDHVSTVYFSKYGLSNTLQTVCDYQDRGLVLFSAKNKQAKIRLYNVLRLLNSGSLYLAIAEKLNEQPDLETVQIEYLRNDIIEVKDLGDEIAKIVAEKLGGTDVDLRLGVHSAESRFNYNLKIRNELENFNRIDNNKSNKTDKTVQNDELTVYLRNLLSYTLVNTNHIKALQTQCGKEISYKNFRPNLVVEGHPGCNYKEENVAEIKISDDITDIIFQICRPWVQDDTINENTAETPEELLGEPYDTLLRTRLIRAVYAPKWHYLPDVPVFGLNMESLDDFTEKKCLLPGAKVFAKFMNPLKVPTTDQEKDEFTEL